MMNGQRMGCYVVFLMLKLTYSHVLAKQNYLISEEWTLENMPFLSTIFAKSEYLPNGPCKEDAQKFLRDLINGSEWAVQMFDSSTKYPDGILYGHTRHLGNFDECYNLHVNIAEENVQTISNIREINGKYCLIDIEYKYKHATSIGQKLLVSKHQNDFFGTNKSFWNFIKNLEDSVHVRRNRLQLALCIPATCNAENVEKALRIPLEKLGASKNIELRTTVQPVSCQTAKEAPKYTLGAGIYCAAILALLSLVITSTWYDNVSRKDTNHTSIMRTIILHFSARRNYERILHVNYTHTGLDSIHFIRLVVSIIALYMHNALQYIYNPTINAIDLEKIYYIPSLTIFINGISIISIFFAMSGVLCASQLLKELDQYKKFNFVKNVVNRYLRLTPLYATLIGFYIWILPALRSGPFWYLVVEECKYCAKNWWTNLLYINNYKASSELCALHSWYLAVDFQLFVCGQFVIYAFWCMSRKIGYPFLGILTLISCIPSFVATYTYNASSVLRITPYITKATELPEFETYYIKTYICATGFFVGMIAGIILHDHRGSTWRLSKFWSQLVYPMPMVLYILSQLWTSKFFISDKTNLLEEAIFAFFQRLIPSLCVCSTIVLLSVGSGLKSCYNFFTPRWVQPLSNLCYGVYIVNMMLVMCDIGQARTVRTFGILKSIWDSIPLLIFSFLLSLLLAICIEMPCRNLAKCLFSENNKIVVNENNKTVVKRRMSESKIVKEE